MQETEKNLELYQKLYHKLFNAVTDALEQMDRGAFLRAGELLKQAQMEAEVLYIQGIS